MCLACLPPPHSVNCPATRRLQLPSTYRLLHCRCRCLSYSPQLPPTTTPPQPAPPPVRPQSSRAVSDAEQRQQLLAEAAEVAAFLRTSVVQAAVNERGHYEVAISEEHTGALVEQVTPDMKLPRVGGGPKAAAVPKAAKPRAAQP